MRKQKENTPNSGEKKRITDNREKTNRTIWKYNFLDDS
jgi:hypothetical protein